MVVAFPTAFRKSRRGDIVKTSTIDKFKAQTGNSYAGNLAFVSIDIPGLNSTLFLFISERLVLRTDVLPELLYTG